MAHFKNTTTGKNVVMGRKTFESIGKPLPNRKNIILSRDKKLAIPGVETHNDVLQLLKKYKEEDIYVIGGKSIYEVFLPHADKLIISQINDTYNCDTFMDKLNLDDFILEATDAAHAQFTVKHYAKR
jgi:dihydrofolate reductase